MAPNLSFTGVLDGYGMKSPFPGGFLCRRRNSNAQGWGSFLLLRQKRAQWSESVARCKTVRRQPEMPSTLGIVSPAADVTTWRDRDPLERKATRQQGLGGSPQIQEGYFVIEFSISMILQRPFRILSHTHVDDLLVLANITMVLCSLKGVDRWVEGFFDVILEQVPFVASVLPWIGWHWEKDKW